MLTNVMPVTGISTEITKVLRVRRLQQDPGRREQRDQVGLELNMLIYKTILLKSPRNGALPGGFRHIRGLRRSLGG